MFPKNLDDPGRPDPLSGRRLSTGAFVRAKGYRLCPQRPSATRACVTAVSFNAADALWITLSTPGPVRDENHVCAVHTTRSPSTSVRCITFLWNVTPVVSEPSTGQPAWSLTAVPNPTAAAQQSIAGAWRAARHSRSKSDGAATSLARFDDDEERPDASKGNRLLPFSALARSRKIRA